MTGMMSSEEDEDDVFKTLTERVVHRRELRDNEDGRKKGKPPVSTQTSLPNAATQNSTITTQANPTLPASAVPVVSTHIASATTTSSTVTTPSTVPAGGDGATGASQALVDPYDKVLKLAKATFDKPELKDKKIHQVNARYVDEALR